MATDLKDLPVTLPSTGTATNGKMGQLDKLIEAWARKTTDPSGAKRLYLFYKTNLGLADGDARMAAEDSLRINQEVEQEFSVT